jgi:hypothetical protein
MAVTAADEAGQEWAETVSVVSESVQSCLASLASLWTELGLGEKERKNACQVLVHDVRKVFEDTIKDTQETKAQVFRLLRRVIVIHVLSLP